MSVNVDMMISMNVDRSLSLNSGSSGSSVVSDNEEVIPTRGIDVQWIGARSCSLEGMGRVGGWGVGGRKEGRLRW